MSNFLTGLMVAGITTMIAVKWEVQRIVEGVAAALIGLSQ
jgi:hypothetical protein